MSLSFPLKSLLRERTGNIGNTLGTYTWEHNEQWGSQRGHNRNILRTIGTRNRVNNMGTVNRVNNTDCFYVGSVGPTTGHILRTIGENREPDTIGNTLGAENKLNNREHTENTGKNGEHRGSTGHNWDDTGNWEPSKQY